MGRWFLFRGSRLSVGMGGRGTRNGRGSSRVVFVAERLAHVGFFGALLLTEGGVVVFG